MESLSSTLGSIAAYLLAMGVISLLELWIPLRARGSWSRAHALPNLSLTLLAFLVYALLHGGVVVGLALLETHRIGLLPLLGLGSTASTLVALLVLDLVTYVAHVTMHKTPALWLFHRIHHSDPTVDVTTSLRQHPGESVVRVAFLAAAALPLGVSPQAYALYRLASAVWAFLEHANLRCPERLDAALALVVTWPTLHKVHHSRDALLTDTNYGNLVSIWDRLFGTFTPVRVGQSVEYGLPEFEAPAIQTTRVLLAAPFAAAPVGSEHRTAAEELAVKSAE